jgi:hypothetical protein
VVSEGKVLGFLKKIELSAEHTSDARHVPTPPSSSSLNASDPPLDEPVVLLQRLHAHIRQSGLG